jgi:hypothetical protein
MFSLHASSYFPLLGAVNQSFQAQNKTNTKDRHIALPLPIATRSSAAGSNCR